MLTCLHAIRLADRKCPLTAPPISPVSDRAFLPPCNQFPREKLPKHCLGEKCDIIIIACGHDGMGEWLRRNGVEFDPWRWRPQLPWRQVSDGRPCRREGSELSSGVRTICSVGRPQMGLSLAEGFKLLGGGRAEVLCVGGDA